MINAHDIVFVTLGLTSPALCLPHSQFLLSPLYSHRLVFICKLFIKQKNRKEKKAKKKQKREKKNKTKQKSYFLLTHYLLSVMTLLYAESAWHALYKYGLIVFVILREKKENRRRKEHSHRTQLIEIQLFKFRILKTFFFSPFMKIYTCIWYIHALGDKPSTWR